MIEKYVAQIRLLWKGLRPIAIVLANYTSTEFDNEVIVFIDNLLKEE